MNTVEIQRVIDEFQPLAGALPTAIRHNEPIATARCIWPEGNLPLNRVAWFCDLFRALAPNNRTILYFAPEIVVEGEVVRIGGATNAPMMLGALADALRAVGIANVRNEMRVLPEQGLSNDRLYGICAATEALTFDQPSEHDGPQTQLLRGEPVFLLDHDPTTYFYLLHAADGYWGWVPAAAIRVVPAAEFHERIDSWTGVAPPQSATERGRKSAESRAVSLGTEVAARALQLLHRPYVFGGVAPNGLDCSGLVRWAWAPAGVFLARDAAQQFPHGRLVATRYCRTGIRAGDLLYFTDACGRIHHTAIALTPTHYAHSAAPAVRINSLQEGDRLYDAERARTFIAAKRIIHNC